jgi:tetratricopeptide (TPR) repeat protein
VIAVTDTPFLSMSEPNQQMYERLRLSVSLNLRRQIFIAVCDDLILRDRLAGQLEADLAIPPAFDPNASSHSTYPRLVSLSLNLNDPNPIAHIAEWLSQSPPPQIQGKRQSFPGFQFLGIEQLTRQPAVVQRLFFTYLQGIERNLPVLESSVLFWMPRPWFNMLPQAASDFWRSRTAVFEFQGEPTPLSVVSPPPEAPPVVEEPTQEGGEPDEPAPPPPGEPTRPIRLDGDDLPLTQEELWEVLNHDLAAFDQTARSNHPIQPPDDNGTEDLSNGRAQSDLHDKNHSAQPVTLQTDLPDLSAKQEASQAATLQRLKSTLKGAIATSQPPQEKAKPAVRLTSDVVVQPNAKVPAPTERAIALQPITIAKKVPITVGTASATSTEQEVATITTGVKTLDREQEEESPPSEDTWQALKTQPLTMLQPEMLLQQIEVLHQQQAQPSALANAYRVLGNLYRERVEQGRYTQEDLMQAIRAYEQVLVWLHETSPIWPDVLNDIANLYWMRSRQSQPGQVAIAHLEQAIHAYQLALNKVNSQTQLTTYSMIQNNLGAAYGDLARHHHPIENLQRSIQAYQQSLRYRQPNTEPFRYALTHNNLGTTYWNLAQHQQPKVYLKQAIASYSEALQYYPPEQDPMNHAMIQNNLGTAYWNLSQHERPQDWLNLAITAYQIALKYRTKDSNPIAFAATQNNLGTAYWHMATHTKEELEIRQGNLKHAIHAYGRAIATAHEVLKNPIYEGRGQVLNFDLCATYNNLGLAHYQTASDTQAHLSIDERMNHLDMALNCHIYAWENWQAKPNLQQATLPCILQTIRAMYSYQGITGQNLALSKVPGHLLPEILTKL